MPVWLARGMFWQYLTKRIRNMTMCSCGYVTVLPAGAPSVVLFLAQKVHASCKVDLTFQCRPQRANTRLCCLLEPAGAFCSHDENAAQVERERQMLLLQRQRQALMQSFAYGALVSFVRTGSETTLCSAYWEMQPKRAKESSLTVNEIQHRYPPVQLDELTRTRTRAIPWGPGNRVHTRASSGILHGHGGLKPK